MRTADTRSSGGTSLAHYLFWDHTSPTEYTATTVAGTPPAQDADVFDEDAGIPLDLDALADEEGVGQEEFVLHVETQALADETLGTDVLTWLDGLDTIVNQGLEVSGPQHPSFFEVLTPPAPLEQFDHPAILAQGFVPPLGPAHVAPSLEVEIEDTQPPEIGTSTHELPYQSIDMSLHGSAFPWAYTPFGDSPYPWTDTPHRDSLDPWDINEMLLGVGAHFQPDPQ